MAEPVRLIKRYANRKLYDTGSGELTSLRRIERLLGQMEGEQAAEATPPPKPARKPRRPPAKSSSTTSTRTKGA